MNADVQWLCNELISALIEGGAQGGLIIGLIWVCLKLCPRANAATRHAAWFATLLVAALLPVVIFAQSVVSKFQPKEKASPSLATTVATPEPAVEPTLDELPVSDELMIEPSIPVVDAIPETSSAIPATPERTAPAFNWALRVPSKVSLGLIPCWLVLASIRLGVLAAQLVALRKIKKLALPAPEILAEPFHAIVTAMGISRTPRLLLSDKAIAPMVVGFFQPAMLLPKFVTERCNSAQLEHLFRHELAHLARCDDWTNLLQQVIAAVFFFHPGILFVSRRLTAEREIACDDHALAIGRAPRDYALFLTEFASQMKNRDFTAAPAAWSSKSQLKERIGMILNGKRNASPRVSRAGVGAIAATAATLAIAALAITPRFIVAAEPPEPPVAPEAPVALSVEAPVAPSAEIAVSAAPALPAAPSAGVIAVAPALPAGVTIASVTAPREKFDIPSPKISVNVAPRISPTPRIAQAEPGEPRRPKRVERDGDDIERRLDRLEKMVEELVSREKRKGPGSERPGWESNFQYKPQAGLPQDFDKQMHEQLEQAHRDADRARRDAERAVREQKMAMDQHMSAERQREWAGQMKLNADRDSLKARKHALEEQRKRIEKELQALEKEIQNQDEAKRAEKERDKRNKPDDKQDKLEKKTRDKDSDDDDSRKAK